MQISDYLSARTGLSVAALFSGASPLVRLQQIGPDVELTHWDSSLGVAPTAAEISAALAAPNPAPSPAQLLAYANAHQWALATGGHAVTLGGASHVFATDPVSLTMMGGKVSRLAQPSPPTAFNWQTPDGSWLTIAAVDFPAIATSCADFVQATFDTLKTVEAQIAAATITTTAQIDAFAWPA